MRTARITHQRHNRMLYVIVQANLEQGLHNLRRSQPTRSSGSPFERLYGTALSPCNNCVVGDTVTIAGHLLPSPASDPSGRRARDSHGMRKGFPQPSCVWGGKRGREHWRWIVLCTGGCKDRLRTQRYGKLVPGLTTNETYMPFEMPSGSEKANAMDGSRRNPALRDSAAIAANPFEPEQIDG